MNLDNDVILVCEGYRKAFIAYNVIGTISIGVGICVAELSQTEKNYHPDNYSYLNLPFFILLYTYILISMLGMLHAKITIYQNYIEYAAFPF